jgi:hypothetical protein
LAVLSTAPPSISGDAARWRAIFERRTFCEIELTATACLND